MRWQRCDQGRGPVHSSAREVHHKAVVLGDDNLSPPGFTACVLIDESHVTAHCYSERGLLAIDIFTCGGKPSMPMEIALAIHHEITNKVPSSKLCQQFQVPRFMLD